MKSHKKSTSAKTSHDFLSSNSIIQKKTKGKEGISTARVKKMNAETQTFMGSKVASAVGCDDRPVGRRCLMVMLRGDGLRRQIENSICWRRTII